MHELIVQDMQTMHNTSALFAQNIAKSLFIPNGLSDARINALDYLRLRIVAFSVSLLKKKGFLSVVEMLAEGDTVFLANRAKHIITEFLRLNAKNQKLQSILQLLFPLLLLSVFIITV